MPKMRVYISKDGNDISAEGEGFSGDFCIKIRDKLFEKLASVKEEKLKPEYYEDAKTNTTLFIGG